MRKKDNSSLIFKAAGMLLVAFALTFACRCIYEVYFSRNDIVLSYPNYMRDGYELLSISKVSNVASDKVIQRDASGSSIMIDQKYEKIADISASTTDFDRDNQNIRRMITDSEAVIQMENLSGLPGARSLKMTIGVMPDRFDSIVELIGDIGEVVSFNVNKADKTAEFKALIAQQETLKKTRESYLEIKKMGGDIQALLLLEDKILEVEGMLQSMNVDIGVYSEENSFCTVNFSLSEATGRSISVRYILQSVRSSFFWTLSAHALLILVVLSALLAAWVGIYLIDKIRHFPGLASIAGGSGAGKGTEKANTIDLNDESDERHP
jgi:hypothetical protein